MGPCEVRGHRKPADRVDRARGAEWRSRRRARAGSPRWPRCD